LLKYEKEKNNWVIRVGLDFENSIPSDYQLASYKKNHMITMARPMVT
jgi:hypothetical protein